MKAKHLILAAVAALFTFAACQPAEEDLGEPNIDLSTASVAFGQGASSQTITLNSTRDWKAQDIADWLVVEPASGKAAKADQTITITVLENTGSNRNCSIKFTCGIDSEYLAVTQEGPGGGPVEGEGTKASPYSASQANRLGAELGAEEQLADVFVSGKISTIKSVDTSFGNAEYYISDDGKADNEFYIYRGYSLGGNKFKTEDEIKVGDEVVVYGTIVNFKGNTVEMTTGSRIVVLNGQEFEGGDEGGGDVDPITGTSLLTNGSFEDWTDAKPDGWNFSKGNATLTKSSDAKEGSNACEVSGSADSNLRLMSKEYVLLAGTYQIQAYIKGEGQYRVGYTVLENGAPKDSDSYIYVDEAPVQASSDWTLHTVQFKLEAQTSVSVTIMNSKKGAGKTILVDDVKLVTNDGGLGEGGGDDGGDDGGDTPGPGEFESSLDKPASASAALAYAQTLADGVEVEAYVKGKISKIDELSTKYGNATYWISDDGTDNQAFEIYRGYYLNGEKFTAEDQIKTGDEVIVFGKIVNFKGNTPEMTTGSKIMSINGQSGSGDDGGEGGDDGGQGGSDDYQNAPAATVAEFLAAKDASKYYKLTGKVDNFGAANCRFDLVDASGSVYVYSVKNADEWSSKLKKGGTVTLAGKYSYYEAGNQEEVVDAYILSYDASTETGSEGLSHPLTSGITWTLGANAYDNTSSGQSKQCAVVNGQEVDNLLKLSSSKNAGNATLTIPSGCTKIGFYACGWSAADITVGSEKVSVKKNAGCTGNPAYTLELSDADYYEVAVSGGTVDVSCPTRVLLIGINAVE